MITIQTVITRARVEIIRTKDLLLSLFTQFRPFNPFPLPTIYPFGLIPQVSLIYQPKQGTPNLNEMAPTIIPKYHRTVCCFVAQFNLI
jgi:hypothetical protein